MNSFISWIGGKKLLRKQITSQFPTDSEIERYIEVFGGAGWVLFGKDVTRGQLEVFNDINGDLINLYRCIKYHCNEVKKELQFLLNSRELFFDVKEQLKMRGLTDIQRAARYFYVIRISFGSDRRSFGTNKKSLPIEYLTEVSERLKNVVIEDKSYKSLIKVYDRKKALFYLDPPYFGTEKYYDNIFSLEDHQHLKSLLDSISGKFILSYNDCEFIKKLYSSYCIEEIRRSSNLVKEAGGEYKELIIKNY